MEPIDSGVVNSPPRLPKKQVVDLYMLARVCVSAAVIICGTLWVYKNEVSITRLVWNCCLLNISCNQYLLEWSFLLSGLYSSVSDVLLSIYIQSGLKSLFFVAALDFKLSCFREIFSTFHFYIFSKLSWNAYHDFKQKPSIVHDHYCIYFWWVSHGIAWFPFLNRVISQIVFPTWREVI